MTEKKESTLSEDLDEAYPKDAEDAVQTVLLRIDGPVKHFNLPEIIEAARVELNVTVLDADIANADDESGNDDDDKWESPSEPPKQL